MAPTIGSCGMSQAHLRRRTSSLGPRIHRHRKHAIPNFIMPEPLIIGYLTSQYARVGDTFIRREVALLRRLGHVVHTFSIRRADPGESISEDIRQEQAQTEYLWEAGYGQVSSRRA